ncbi:MAG: glycosyltransferase [Coleofasciculus sp. C1-SOL-03]|uniref:glycosyltransferase family 2 protein n=1 Tax=Coleofasciculus sp. C1-SOL-03 TaxID=3069522 RepID=UPI0032F17F56
MNSKPLFSVIVPTYHRNDLLVKCLDCLSPDRQTLPIDQYEVIVTDDGSQSTAAAMIQECYPWAKWVAGLGKGPAANRNNGVKYAQGEWLAFTDDDCLPDPQWLTAYTQAIVVESPCLVFEGRVYVDRPRCSLAETAPTNESGGYLWSCNFAIQRQLFESLGGFDERFPYAAMEDVDLRLRLTNCGYQYSFIKAASVCHPWRQKPDYQQSKQRQESILLYLSIHPQELDNINSTYYVRAFLKSLLNNIVFIKTIRKMDVKYLALESFFFLRMAFVIIVRFEGIWNSV